MSNKNTIFRQLSLLLSVFLIACASGYQKQDSAELIQSLSLETDDLGAVVADSLSLARQVGKGKVLVVLDIDNTILAMEQGLGADQWYDWQKELNQNDPCSSHNVGNRFAVQGALYFVSAMRRTQQDAADLLSTIQNTGIRVISVTSRGPDYRLQTFRELRRNDFDFSYTAIGPARGYAEPFVPVENGRLSRYENGVFFTAGQHKGQMLYALLEKTSTPMPAVIVMADDKQKNLDAVNETFSALNIPVRAWRYSSEDHNVSAFDPELAHTQWKSIENALIQIQQVLGPDNYDLSHNGPPIECQKEDGKED